MGAAAPGMGKLMRNDIGAPYEEGWELVNESQLRVMDEVVVERKHFDYKSGYPVGSSYYRAIVGEHKTVAGPRKHLTNEPNVEFPEVAPWYGRRIYAGNDGVTQMWRRTDGTNDE